MSSATGETIFNAIKRTLDWYGLDMKKCIGFGCDGANVMIGQHNSVWSRLREVNPNCILMKCNCHSLTLCVQHGFNKLPSNLGYVLQEIPGWFSQSTIRRDEYKVYMRNSMTVHLLQCHSQSSAARVGFPEEKLFQGFTKIGILWTGISPMSSKTIARR